MEKTKINILNIIFFVIVLCNESYSQNQNLNDIYKEISDTNRKEMSMMIDFLVKNEVDFTTNTDLKYLLDIVYEKNQTFFGLDKLYLKEKYNAEAYLFYSTSSHANTYIMICNDNDVVFLGKGNLKDNLSLLLKFTDRNIKSKCKIKFLQQISGIFTYMTEWNYKIN
ncbi:hypothetical protein SAMN02927937_02917 [Paenimyroides aquimaris]|uniref:Uncharacterized protein n=1 Tax=Paenimyroides marinum TaxID=1159016 RepID=A0A1H6MWJ0_9FLAO|nr:hypothetical protein [Paenimyroides aquimaris]SEI04151.1 hypothetical protein SAMN02927937_02917 [Paenimyroides aquimaris]